MAKAWHSVGASGHRLWLDLDRATTAPTSLLAQDVPTLTATPVWEVVNEVIAPHGGDAVAGFVTIQERR
ncbi:MAG: hypothetical protein R2867_02330 [Caldilineaceae bacterium]